MGYKEDFLTALNESLPEGILELLEKEIPEAPSVTVSDVDSAIIANGHLAKYLLDLFNTFKGLTPVELLLRIGQKNATLQAAFLAGIEYTKGEGEYDFSISLDPTIVYTDSPIPFQLEVINGEDKAVSASSLQNIELTKVENQPIWEGEYVWTEAGQPTLTFTITFDTPDGSYDCKKSVTIQVGEGGPQ